MGYNLQPERISLEFHQSHMIFRLLRKSVFKDFYSHTLTAMLPLQRVFDAEIFLVYIYY